jgi:aspartate/methionine/tyrosine aminotransferase
MKINDFKLEVYFGKYEFTAPYLLTQSDCESMELQELLKYEPGSEEGLMHNWLGYTEVPGDPELRKLVSSLYSNIKDDEILMHCGAQEAIYDFMSVMLEKNDHVISMFPIYQSLYEVANAEGCEVTPWELRDEGDKWVIDFDELEKMIKPNTKLIVINTPNNPTGYTLSEEEIQRLCQIANKHGVYIFSDEVYRGLDLDNVKKPWVCDFYDKAVSLGVMSKAYGLAGLRIGWVATRDKTILAKMTKMKHYLSICNSCASEYLAKIALRHSDEILEKNKEIIRKNMAIADAFFDKYKNLFVNHKPQSGPIAFHKMNIEQPIDEFCEELVQRKGVLLLPANIYGYKGQYFRMGYGRQGFEENLGKFEEYLIENKLV